MQCLLHMFTVHIFLINNILGGLSHPEDDKDKMSNPDLRKARFDLLFREYEVSFEFVFSKTKLICLLKNAK